MKTSVRHPRPFPLVIATVVALAGCGGGGDSGGTTSTPPPTQGAGGHATVQGVAAVGAALDGTVVIKDSTGATQTGATDPTDGQFSFDVSSMTPPFILRAQGPDGGFLYSMSVDKDVANINPLSTVVIGTASQTVGAGTDPDALYQAFATFAPQVGTGALDRATATVYGELSLPFKAALGSSDANPIYAPYAIGNAMDQAFDSWEIYYDAVSGDFQETPSTDNAIQGFGLLPDLLDQPTHRAGTLSGTYLSGSGSTAPLWVNIDRHGNVIVYQQSDPATVTFCVAAATLGNCFYTASYTLDSHGLFQADSSTASRSAFVITSLTTYGISLKLSTDGINSGVYALNPDVGSTYGNNLKGAAANFAHSTLGPFVLDVNLPLMSGSSSGGHNLWFADSSTSDPANEVCKVSENWSVTLQDLEFSTYAAALHETVSAPSVPASAPPAACAVAPQDFDAVGQGFFTPQGFFTILVDRASAANPKFAYQFVAVKQFLPN